MALRGRVGRGRLLIVRLFSCCDLATLSITFLVWEGRMIASDGSRHLSPYGDW